MPMNFMGYSLFSGNVATCAAEIAAEVNSGRRRCKVMACLNPHSFVVARDDLLFQSALKDADWLVPDGIGIVLAARWLGTPISTRVTGPDVFMSVMEYLDEVKGSVFFLGSSEMTLMRIRRRIQEDFPGVIIAGTYSPPFGRQFTSKENAAMLAAVNAARPDVLWIGMTAPKQEKWLAENREKLEVGVSGAVGAAFDFFAGTVKRSPKIFRILGLEWLPRLIQQPHRLWRRMFISMPRFVAEVARERNRRIQTKNGNG